MLAENPKSSLLSGATFTLQTLGTLAYPSLQEMTLGEVVGGPQSCPTFDLFMEIQIGNVTKLGHIKKIHSFWSPPAFI